VQACFVDRGQEAVAHPRHRVGHIGDRDRTQWSSRMLFSMPLPGNRLHKARKASPAASAMRACVPERGKGSRRPYVDGRDQEPEVMGVARGEFCGADAGGARCEAYAAAPGEFELKRSGWPLGFRFAPRAGESRSVTRSQVDRACEREGLPLRHLRRAPRVRAGRRATPTSGQQGRSEHERPGRGSTPKQTTAHASTIGTARRPLEQRGGDRQP
jgi:hypothetical protein